MLKLHYVVKNYSKEVVEDMVKLGVTSRNFFTSLPKENTASHHHQDSVSKRKEVDDNYKMCFITNILRESNNNGAKS